MSGRSEILAGLPDKLLNLAWRLHQIGRPGERAPLDELVSLIKDALAANEEVAADTRALGGRIELEARAVFWLTRVNLSDAINEIEHAAMLGLDDYLEAMARQVVLLEMLAAKYAVLAGLDADPASEPPRRLINELAIRIAECIIAEHPLSAEEISQRVHCKVGEVHVTVCRFLKHYGFYNDHRRGYYPPEDLARYLRARSS